MITAGVTANFNNTPVTHCKPPDTINFTNLSTNGSNGHLSYTWSFGDGGIDTSQSPSYIYIIPKVDSVKLTVQSSAGCSNSITKVINVLNYQTNFTVQKDSTCTGVSQLLQILQFLLLALQVRVGILVIILLFLIIIIHPNLGLFLTLIMLNLSIILEYVKILLRAL